jgi:hypothetical protein
MDSRDSKEIKGGVICSQENGECVLRYRHEFVCTSVLGLKQNTKKSGTSRWMNLLESDVRSNSTRFFILYELYQVRQLKDLQTEIRSVLKLNIFPHFSFFITFDITPQNCKSLSFFNPPKILLNWKMRI